MLGILQVSLVAQSFSIVAAALCSPVLPRRRLWEPPAALTPLQLQLGKESGRCSYSSCEGEHWVCFFLFWLGCLVQPVLKEQKARSLPGLAKFLHAAPPCRPCKSIISTSEQYSWVSLILPMPRTINFPVKEPLA